MPLFKRKPADLLAKLESQEDTGNRTPESIAEILPPLEPVIDQRVRDPARAGLQTTAGLSSGRGWVRADPLEVSSQHITLLLYGPPPSEEDLHIALKDARFPGLTLHLRGHSLLSRRESDASRLELRPQVLASIGPHRSPLERFLREVMGIRQPEEERFAQRDDAWWYRLEEA